MTGDSFNTYTWDAEDRLNTVNGTAASYTYDAIGWRVQKTTGAGSVQYLFDTSGNVTEELNGSTLNRAEIYLGSIHLGTYTGGNIYFSHSDLLGTEHARTLSTAPGVATQTCTGLPFADGQTCTGTDTSPLHFTGLERDAESGLDQTWFRKYSSAQGRWLVPDPLGASADPGAPQTFDRYTYAGNNPMNFVDPLGLQMSWNGGDCPSDDPCPEDFLGPDFTDRFYLCELYGFCPGDGNPTVRFHGCLPPGVAGPPTSECLAHTPGANTGKIGTIRAGSLDILNDYCSARGRAKFVADWVPGGGVLARNLWGSYVGEAMGFHQLSNVDLNRITEETSGGQTVALHVASEGLKTAGKSAVFLTWFRGASGVPKTLAGKWLGRVSTFLVLVDAGSGFYKEGKEILDCQEGH